MKIVTGANGKLETVGSADADAKTEAQIRAEIAKQRVELRKMLDGNVQFHEDGLAKPGDKSKTAFQRIMDDDLLDADLRRLLDMRGGCGCGWPNAMPPCGACSSPITEDEAEYLAEFY